jgi:hypothetical protein
MLADEEAFESHVATDDLRNVHHLRARVRIL